VLHVSSSLIYSQSERHKLLTSALLNCLLKYPSKLSIRLGHETAGVRIPTGAEISSLRHGVRPALRPTQPPDQWIAVALSPGVKRPGDEGENLPPSSTEVKNTWSCTSTPHTSLSTGITLSLPSPPPLSGPNIALTTWLSNTAHQNYKPRSIPILKKMQSDRCTPCNNQTRDNKIFRNEWCRTFPGCNLLLSSPFRRIIIVGPCHIPNEFISGSPAFWFI
jgi:hypothetical protein